jgi:2,3,4,5-tetrahydropyridine-2-carboxylate N-succinyltransferase
MQKHLELSQRISAYFARIADLKPPFAAGILADVKAALDLLDRGECRVATKENDKWQVNSWLKEAILLYFKTHANTIIDAKHTNYFDKVAIKYQEYDEDRFQKEGVRVVPNAIARYGSFINTNSVLMPSYVNIGAFVDTGCMIDTWATVGSCAQIGKNVHLSGGAGIGGVLEPLQANPTIIEDNCFIGARSEIVEGVIIEENSVISMGVFISQSTPIYNRATKEIIRGRVPAGSVVVPGSLPAKDGSHSLAAAIIVKTVDAKTRAKVAINELLRDL